MKEPTLKPYIDSYDMLYEKTCVKNSFGVLKVLVTNKIRAKTANGGWLHRLIETGNTNIINYVFENWYKIVPPGNNLTVVLQKIIRWILTTEQSEVPVESLKECLQRCSNTDLNEVFYSIEPHMFCTYRPDIAYVVLENIANNCSPI